MLSPLEVNCPHQNSNLTNCGAGVGEPCRWDCLNPVELYHAERLEVADELSKGKGAEPSVEDFNLAVERSDLI
jgi:hypothetical protein